jgi:hypothetical protein
VDGGRVIFAFDAFGVPHPAGGVLANLVVATDATSFDTNVLRINAIDGNSALTAVINGVFAPTVVPESSTVLLSGLGLLGIVALRKPTVSRISNFKVPALPTRVDFIDMLVQCRRS